MIGVGVPTKLGITDIQPFTPKMDTSATSADLVRRHQAKRV